MKKKEFLIIFLLAVFLLILTGEVVVWKREVSPSATPSFSPTPTTEFKPTVGEPISPSLSENVRDLPTIAPIIITPFIENSSKVQVLPSKSIYQKGETITVLVKNNSNHQLGYYDCPGPKGGIVWFERKIGQTWEEEISLAGADYGSRRPCYPAFLESEQELQVSRRISVEVPSGIYRAVFHYVSGIVYSSEFEIL